MSDQTTANGKIDKQALLAKYLAERDKRLRADGNAQYLRLDGQLSHYKKDPYAEPINREALFDHVTFAFVGGGIAGLVTGARLVEAGITDVRIVEKGGDFGGTWYWNRYPGAQCDTASMVYMPLLEETGHMPSEKYAHGPEILEQCRRIGRKFSLYENALFQTEVTAIEWDESGKRWVISTDRGDRFTASYIGVGTGPLHVPKLPGIPGIETFKGRSFHTSRWDYDYTGGDAAGRPMTKLADKRVAIIGTGPLHVPKLPGISGIETFKGHSFHTSRWDYDYTGGDAAGRPMTKLADKRVAIIGTGATSVQAVPYLARDARRLYVVQRTPSSVDVRANAPIESKWFAGIATPGWQARWMKNFTDNQAGGGAAEDWVQDGWTDLSRRIRGKFKHLRREELTQAAMLAAFEDTDFEKMEEIRARVDSIVADRATAQRLKAWYRQLCKRPCFHDSYLQAFNNPSTTLIDTDGKGVERITEAGFVVAGIEYEVDCIIYASGFEVGTEFRSRAGFDLVGRDGLKLSQAWGEGMKSLHGTHVHGFPNAFFVQPAQGANLISNIPHNLTEAALTIAAIVRQAMEKGAREVEVTREAQHAWVELLLTAPPRLIGSPDCTPGYYNNEGQAPTLASKLNVGYPAGPSAYFRYLDAWRGAGDFKGLAFR